MYNELLITQLLTKSTFLFRIPEFLGVMAGQLAFYAGTETTLVGMDQTV